MDLITPFASIIVGIIAGYVTFRVGRMQVNQAMKAVEVTDKTTGETEFRNSLLEWNDQQEKKLERQDAKIDGLNTLVEQSRTLINDLKRANFDLAIDNQRLKRITDELEHEVDKLRKEVAVLQSVS